MKRVKVTLSKPNPLFELWLEQWKAKAASQESNLQFHFTKALNALRRYPLPLDSGKDCIILKHFGSKLCMMLDKKLEEFKFHQKEVAYLNKICKCDNCSHNELLVLQKRKLYEMHNENITTYKIRQAEARHIKFNVPSWSFTCYAILLTLYGKEEDPSYPGYMHKSELFYESKKLYNASLQLLDPDVYSGKSSIFILISNELISIRKFPIRFHLTKRGAHLAKKINNILNLTSYNKQFLQIYFMKLQDSLQAPSWNYVMNKNDLEPNEPILPLHIRAGKSPKKMNEINLMEEEKEEKSNTISPVLDNGKEHDSSIDFELEQILPSCSRANNSPEKISEINLMEEEKSNTISPVLDNGKEHDSSFDFELEQILPSCSRANNSPKKISEINLMEEGENNTISPILGHGMKYDDSIDLELDEQILPLCSRASKSPKKINKINLMEEEESNTISYVLDHGKKRDKKNALKQSSNIITNMLTEVQGTIQLTPYCFDIILLVDIQETCGGKTKPQDDLTLAELTQLGVPFEVRHLKVGDFTWIAKCKYTKNELVLPYIVERKRLDDLASSIKDGRFREQKFRLKQSGIQNLFYLVEHYERYSQGAITLQTLLQASINSLVQDGFIVKYTDSHQDSMSYLATLTDTLHRIYVEKNLIECSKEDLIPIDVASNSIRLMKFEEFNKASSKQKSFTVRQMFLRQLIQLKGISVAKALAIVEKYPTPQFLINALHKCGEKLIAPIQYGLQKRQIGPVISRSVYLFYTKHELN